MSFLFSRAVGVDIADRSIEIIELAKRGGSAHITALGRVMLPEGVVERGRIKDRPALAAAVREVFRGAETIGGWRWRRNADGIAPHQIIFGLPDSQVYIHPFSCLWEAMSQDKEALGAMILAEAREHVPLEESDLLLSYKILQRTDTGLDFLIAAVSRQLVDDWQKFFAELGLRPEFDLEAIAIFRGIFPESVERPVMTIDCGAVTTTLAIFDQNGLRYSRTLPQGGENLTKMIASTLKIKSDVAEAKKREIGILDPENQIFTVLLRELGPLKDEIKATIDYYERWSGRKIHGLLLVGGGSQLRGLADYFRSNFELPTGVARSPFVRQPIVYLEAIGLALGGLGRRNRNELIIRPGVNTGSGFKPHSPLGLFFRGNLGLVLLLAVLVAGTGLIFFAWQYRQAKEIDRVAARQAALDKIPTVSPLPAESVSSTTPITVASTTAKTIKVAETPTGWLNVRSGPGTSFASVGRVNPGEVYPLLAEEKGWYRIQFSQTKEGWVARQYATIIKN